MTIYDRPTSTPRFRFSLSSSVTLQTNPPFFPTRNFFLLFFAPETTIYFNRSRDTTTQTYAAHAPESLFTLPLLPVTGDRSIPGFKAFSLNSVSFFGSLDEIFSRRAYLDFLAISCHGFFLLVFNHVLIFPASYHVFPHGAGQICWCLYYCYGSKSLAARFGRLVWKRRGVMGGSMANFGGLGFLFYFLFMGFMSLGNQHYATASTCQALFTNFLCIKL